MEEGREGGREKASRPSRRLRFADSIRADVGRRKKRKDGDGDNILWKRRMWLERAQSGVTT